MTTKKTLLIMCWLLSWGTLLQAQVTIGLDAQGNVGALLDLREITPTDPSTDNITSDKGLGLTRVNLTSQKNLFPMFDDDGNNGYTFNGTAYTKSDEDLKHIGLIVYNIGTTLTPGLYIWNGSEWRMFSSQTSEKVSATLRCSAATMSPDQNIVGGTAIKAGTVLLVPHTQSNGGSVTGVTLTSTGNTDVTASISNTTLFLGNGYLIFELSGTPTTAQEAPTGITFDLTPLLDANPGLTSCSSITIGDTSNSAVITQTAAIGQLSSTDQEEYFRLECDSPDGNFSVRIAVPKTAGDVAAGSPFINIQLKNNTSTALPIMWNYGAVTGSGNQSSAGILTIPSQEWGGDNGTASTWATISADNTNYGGFWGGSGAYNGSNHGPEYRRYTWLPQGTDHKTSYEVTTMVAIDNTSPSTAVSPDQLKGYIKFTQVTTD